MRCLLCENSDLADVRHESWIVPFYHCPKCDLIFREPASFPNWEEQKTRYDLHQNSAEDLQYVQYLRQFLAPVTGYLHEKGLERGLDWGSGPGPTLSHEMRKLGFEMQDYDPLYCPQKPKGVFDFITATEVIEHFQNPKKELQDLLRFVRAEGIFAGMTGFHQGVQAFSNWWYARDITHVCFYSEKTLRWVAGELGLKVLELQTPVFIFERG